MKLLAGDLRRIGSVLVVSMLFVTVIPVYCGTGSDLTAPFVNVRDKGAKGDGAADDTDAIQAAIDEARGKPVYLPAGSYVVTRSLHYRTSGYQPALKLFGDGMMATNLISKVQAGAVLSMDGTGRNDQFQMGGYIRDLSIDGVGKSKSSVSGIELQAVWDFTIERVRIKSLTGDGVVMPLRTDISTNPDLYATVFVSVTQSEISFNGGWGIHAANGIGGGGLQVQQCRIIANAGGGIYTGAHNIRVIDNAIASNGGNVPDSGGLVIDYVNGGGNGADIEDNEFDSNYRFHVWVRGADTFRIVANRFNSWESNIWKDGVLHPATHVRLGGAGRAVRDFLISQNYHRSQYSKTGARADHALLLYEVMDANVAGVIERPWIPGPDNTPKVTKISGIRNGSVEYKDSK